MENRTIEQNLNKCMDTLLQSVANSYVQAYSISMVPCELKKSPNDDAYIPRVVSMGPRYKNSREVLMQMEEIKLRCMLSLLHRTGKNEADTNLTKCCTTICGLNEAIRASYVEDIRLEKLDLAKIMVVDGCFLLELLITKGFDSELPSRWKLPTPTAPQVLQNEDVLSDLTLFENQIPIFIIHELSKILFPHFFKQNSEQRATIINNLALSILGYSLSENQSLDGEPSHLLDVVHSFVNNNNDDDDNNNNNSEVGINMHNSQTQHDNMKMKLKLKRCVTRLQAAGITIQLAQDKGATGLEFEFKYKEGKLEIAALHITKTTKAKWLNVIAWEHHKEDWKKACSNKDTVAVNEIRTTYGKFTAAALIFSDLICCADDVKLLKDKKIIVDDTKKSNKQLEEFIRTMSTGVEHGIVGSGYFKMVDELNKHSTVCLPIRILKKLRHYFTYYYECFKKFIKTDYHFVATLVSLCTVVQTVYALVAYHKPAK